MVTWPKEQTSCLLRPMLKLRCKTCNQHRVGSPVMHLRRHFSDWTAWTLCYITLPHLWKFCHESVLWELVWKDEPSLLTFQHTWNIVHNLQHSETEMKGNAPSWGTKAPGNTCSNPNLYPFLYQQQDKTFLKLHHLWQTGSTYSA